MKHSAYKYISAILILTVCFVIIPHTTYAAITIDSTEASGAGHRCSTTNCTLSWTFTNTAGNFLICSFVATESSGVITMNTPTYNGSNMTLAGSQLGWDTNTSKTAIYYMTSPPTGGNTVSMSTSGGGGTFAVLGGCMSFGGVDTSSPIGTPTTGTNSSGTTATAGSITAAATSYIFAGGGWGSGTGGTAGGSFTRTFLTNGSGNTAGDNILGEYIVGTGGSISPTFTWTGSDHWGIQAVEIKAGTSVATTAGVKIVNVGVVDIINTKVINL